jgi:hypothetical protein
MEGNPDLNIVVNCQLNVVEKTIFLLFSRYFFVKIIL